MTTDWRLIPNNAYLERIAREEKECRKRYAPSDWSAWATPLVTLANDIAEGNKPKDSATLKDIPDVIAQAWETVRNGIVNHSHLGHVEPMARVLAAEMVTGLAERVSDKPQVWLSAAKIAGLLPEGWHVFLTHVNATAIARHQDTLFNLPTLDNPNDWIDTYGALKDPVTWTRYFEEIREHQSSMRDPWTFLEDTSRLSQEVMPCTSLYLKSGLTRRLGLSVWIRWLGQLPVVSIAEALLQDLKSLDEAYELLALALKNQAEDNINSKLTSVMILRRTVKLCQDIWRNLEQGANESRVMPMDDPARLQLFVKAVQDWKEHELKECATNIATLLIQSGDAGHKLATIALGHLFAQSWNEHERNIITVTQQEFRKAFIVALRGTNRSPDVLLSEVLGPDPKSAALLAGAQLMLEYDDLKNEMRCNMVSQIWLYYEHWMQSDKFFYNRPLRDDDAQLAWHVAGVLAQANEHVSKFSKLLQQIEIPSEGWMHDYSRFLESEHRVCHVLTVGAMSSDWLMQQKGRKDAVPIFDFVWKFFHRWVRGVRGGLHNNYIFTPLVQLWARLPIIHGTTFTQIALAGIDSLDKIEWILTACENLQMNIAKPNELERSLQESIHRRFEEEFPALRRNQGIEPQQIDKFSKIEHSLTPDIERNILTP